SPRTSSSSSIEVKQSSVIPDIKATSVVIPTSATPPPLPPALPESLNSSVVLPGLLSIPPPPPPVDDDIGAPLTPPEPLPEVPKHAPNVARPSPVPVPIPVKPEPPKQDAGIPAPFAPAKKLIRFTTSPLSFDPGVGIGVSRAAGATPPLVTEPGQEKSMNQVIQAAEQSTHSLVLIL